jgi:hypothetical protein
MGGIEHKFAGSFTGAVCCASALEQKWLALECESIERLNANGNCQAQARLLLANLWSSALECVDVRLITTARLVYSRLQHRDKNRKN